MASHISGLHEQFSTCGLIFVLQRFCARVSCGYLQMHWWSSMNSGQSTEKAGGDVLATLYGDQCAGHVCSSVKNTWKYWKKISHERKLCYLVWEFSRGSIICVKRADCQKNHLGAVILIHTPSLLNVAIYISCILLPNKSLLSFLAKIIFFHLERINNKCIFILSFFFSGPDFCFLFFQDGTLEFKSEFL